MFQIGSGSKTFFVCLSIVAFVILTCCVWVFSWRGGVLCARLYVRLSVLEMNRSETPFQFGIENADLQTLNTDLCCAVRSFLVSN